MAKPTTNRQPELSRALNALRRMVSRAPLGGGSRRSEETNVTAAQLFVLRELGQVPDQSVKDLAAVTMTTHSTVSQVVSQLLSKGLVTRTRDDGDGRRSVLRLTRQGASLVKKSPRVIQADLIKGFATLRAPERSALANALEKWLEASGLGGVPSSVVRSDFSKRSASSPRRKSARR